MFRLLGGVFGSFLKCMRYHSGAVFTAAGGETQSHGEEARKRHTQ